MEQYVVTGMSCAACQARVEKAVGKVPGVTSCAVSLLTNSMGVEGDASPEAIIKAVTDAGYGASLKTGGLTAESGGSRADKGKAATAGSTYAAEEEALADHETPVLIRRLVTSIGFLIVLMYFSMGHTMWGAPLPAFFHNNPVAIALVQMILAAIVMLINKKFFISGFRGLLHRAPNMDTLVALGSAASFVWSTVGLFSMTGAQARGDAAGAMSGLHDLYFESAAMILTLITVGKMLEARSKGKTTDALKSLMKLAPQTAVVLRDGVEVEVPIREVAVGDEFVVRPGENVPVDGIVLEGTSAVNEAALTGESVPVDKFPGDGVAAATTNQAGFIRCRATRVGEDTTLSQIIRMVSDAAATKAPIAKIADRVSGIFVPVVIGIALLTLVIWLAVGQDVGFSLARAISVLVISCPCALGLATPVAIMVGNGLGAKNGILFKTAVSLEETGKTDIVVLDKTGTITKGEPHVTELLPAAGVTEEELLTLALALERKSEHPLAGAVTSYAEARGIKAPEIGDFRAVPGKGLTGQVAAGATGGSEAAGAAAPVLRGGNLNYVEEAARIPVAVKERAEELASRGRTCLYFTEGDRLLGIIAVADVMKEEAPQAIAELKNMGIRVVMLTGDNERTARAIGEEAGVDEVIAGVLPDGKEEVVRQLQEQGKVTMVGDGINDAPALTRADMGIAIGAGADVAIDAADVVLMNSKLSDVPAAVRLSRQTLRNIHQNLFWAFFYNAIGIPLAAGAYIHLFGWTLNPMFGAAAMSLSSFCVVTNALRLNLFDCHSAAHDKKKKQISGDQKIVLIEENENQKTEHKESEESQMKKTMKIEGMMCMHCEAAVKKALEALDGVEEAVVSHETGTAVVTLSADVADEVLKEAVEAKDYPVLGIE
ncbi:MAG: heavy metal translocating P-type ATPase [Firmicutes bacterium]|nr:heavy metal translocating P-type ATPase [Bacillota bacterium]